MLSLVEVLYASEINVAIESAKDPNSTMTPDIVTGLTFEEYMNGTDPALNAILAIPAPVSK